MFLRQLRRSGQPYGRSERAIAFPGALKFERQHTQPETQPNRAPDAGFDFANARPYAEVPGPSLFEFIRGFLPGGAYHNKTMFEMVEVQRKQFGDFFKMPGLFGKPEILVSLNPADYPIIFRNEGQWPMRRTFETITYHRQVHRRDIFKGVEGVIQTNGEKWAQVRTAINPVLMQPKNARLYLDTLREVNDEFLARIREIRNPDTLEMPEDFFDEINRLAFESVCAVALNARLGLIRENRESPEAKVIMHSLKRVFELAFNLEIMPSIWKLVRTRDFKEMIQVLDTLTDICNKYINEAFARIEQENAEQVAREAGLEQSVLEKLLRIDKQIAIATALDMMFAGVDTTSSTLTGILFGIAQNPEKQAKLFEEVKIILPEKDSKLTLDNMRNMPYLRACIKEGIRMYPILVGTVRRLPQDLVLSGYHIPAGKEVSVGGNMLLRDEKFVPRAKEFLPERFLRNEEGSKELSGQIGNPFLYMPFGFGPRSCAGRRIVELELEINLVRLVRNFHIEFNYSTENAFKANFIMLPAIPLKFKFTDRAA